MLEYPMIDPVALSLGPLKVRWYGLMYVIGFTVAWFLARIRAANWRKAGYTPEWTPEQVDELITFSILGLIVGARLGYILFYDLPNYIAQPLDMLKIWKGGMSFHGGALGLVFTTWRFARKYGKTFAQAADFLAPLAPPGLFAGRLGNFINGELWGRVTTSPLGMVFPDPAAGPAPRHPSQLYEATCEGLVLFLLLWWYSARPRAPLAVTGFFLLGYGVLRFGCEFFRQPDVQLGFVLSDWLTMGQLLCIPMMLVGAALLLRARFRGNPAS